MLEQAAQVAAGSGRLGGMDVSAIASLATRMSQDRTAETASMLVLKKALETQESAAMTLIASVPTPPNPSHLGQNVDVRA
jgi:hypothetical protein